MLEAVLCFVVSSTLPACLCLVCWGGFLGSSFGFEASVFAYMCYLVVAGCFLSIILYEFVHTRTTCALYCTRLITGGLGYSGLWGSLYEG